VVTRPDIEKMLYEWCQHMNAKGEVFTGEMLVRKWGRFESLVQMPEDERLNGTSWIASFRRTYGIQEICMHGEAGSVDVVHVEQEQERVKGVLGHFNKRDWWNFDETAFFYASCPDRGLSDRQMSGKKQSKKRITVLIGYSATGEKFQAMFIGKFLSTTEERHAYNISREV